MRERGVEAAAAIREMLPNGDEPGTKTERAFLRLPIVPPTVTMLTAAGPYADMIDLGQTHDRAGDHERLGDGRVRVCRHREERPRASSSPARRDRRNGHAAETAARRDRRNSAGTTGRAFIRS